MHMVPLRPLVRIATKDSELARLIASFPWFADGSFDARSASSGLTSLDRIVSKDIVTRGLVGLSERCVYHMGENFLLNVLEIVGEDAMSSALGELFELTLARASISGDECAQEKLVFDTSLEHTPRERQEPFRELYHRLHGGPYAYPVADRSDDHGDAPTTATEVAVGEVASGNLDYHSDFDYSKFQAKEGQRYRIGVHHEALRASSVWLYAHGKQAPERSLHRWADTRRASYGPQIRWIAPSSGDYYVAVHNFGGKSGQYTLEVTPVASIPDDHGDGAATATDISVGTVVKGTIDYDFDLDFFRFQSVAGREYWLMIRGVTLPFSRVSLVRVRWDNVATNVLTALLGRRGQPVVGECFSYVGDAELRRVLPCRPRWIGQHRHVQADDFRIRRPLGRLDALTHPGSNYVQSRNGW